MNPVLKLVSIMTLGLLANTPTPQHNGRMRLKGDKRAAKRLRKLSEKSRKHNRKAA